MKLGIALLVIGLTLLGGNLYDWQPDPLWALVLRIALSLTVFIVGVIRLNYILRKGKRKNRDIPSKK